MKARAVVPVAVLLAEVLVFFRQVLFLPRYFIPYDFATYHLSLASSLAKALARGELPLWDPYTYCGFPTYADITAQVFYPPTMLAALAGGRHLLYALELQLVAHVLAGGMFTYWLLRRLRLGTPAALIGATIYQLGGYFASQTQHLGAIDAAAWLPFSWLAVLFLAERFQWRWLAALILSFALSLLAGFPQVTAVALGSSILLAVILRRPRLALTVAGAVLWAGLIAAVQLLPTRELTRLSVASLRTEWMDSAAGGLAPQALISLVAPNYFGVLHFDQAPWTRPWNPTFGYLYCSIGGLALALAAVIRRKQKLATEFAILTLLVAVYMLGEHTWPGRILFLAMPGLLRASLYAEFGLAAFVLGIAVLAAFGAEQWLRPRPWQALALAAIAADLILVGSGRPMNTTSYPAVAYDHIEGSREIPERVRALVNTAFPPWRIDTIQGHPYWMQCAPLLEVPCANGNDPFALRRLIQVRLGFTNGAAWGRTYELARPVSPLLDLLNVRYVLSRKPLHPEKLIPIGTVPGQWIFENPGAMPRFFLVSRVAAAKDMQEALAVLRAPGFDPRAVAVVESDVPQLPGGAALPPVRVVRYAPSEVVLETDAPSAAFLVTSEAWYPGWHAWIDGREQSLLITNVAFRGLPVPAGRHLVRMRFAPRVLRQGAWISFAALLSLVGCAWFRR